MAIEVRRADDRIIEVVAFFIKICCKVTINIFFSYLSKYKTDNSNSMVSLISRFANLIYKKKQQKQNKADELA